MKFLCFLSVLALFTINANCQTINISYDTVCLGSTISLKAITDLPENTITQYAWDINGDQNYNDASGKTINYQVVVNNSISLKIVTNNETYYKHTNVIFHPLPVALFAVLKGCTGDTVRFIDYSYSTQGTLTSHTWDLTGNGQNTVSGKTNIYSIYKTPGVYQTSLQITNSYGCTSSYGLPVEIKEKPDLQIKKEALCTTDSALFSNQTPLTLEKTARLTWNFGDGSAVNRFSNTIKHLYKATGTYNVSIFAEHINGCTNSLTFPVDIFAKPSLDLTFSGDTAIYPGAQLDVSVTSSYDSLKWLTGSRQSQITIDKAGLFSVELFKDQCKATKSFQIYVLNDQKLVAPQLQSNIITPNNDGRNDKLTFPKLNNYPACTLYVYNQKGVKIYETKHFENDWDMQVNGNILETGAYYYVLEVNAKRFTGNFNILN